MIDTSEKSLFLLHSILYRLTRKEPNHFKVMLENALLIGTYFDKPTFSAVKDLSSLMPLLYDIGLPKDKKPLVLESICSFGYRRCSFLDGVKEKDRLFFEKRTKPSYQPSDWRVFLISYDQTPKFLLLEVVFSMYRTFLKTTPYPKKSATATLILSNEVTITIPCPSLIDIDQY